MWFAMLKVGLVWSSWKVHPGWDFDLYLVLVVGPFASDEG